jgi:ankyrin repeat protein
LHLAAKYGRKEVVELLLGQKAEINVKDSAGKTPLALASEDHHTEVVEMLRQHGGQE